MGEMTQKEMSRLGGKARRAQMTPEEISRLGKIASRKRWGPKSEVTALAEREGISRQAAWARLKRAKKGKKKRKKG
jgi:hypothetical protein